MANSVDLYQVMIWVCTCSSHTKGIFHVVETAVSLTIQENLRKYKTSTIYNVIKSQNSVTRLKKASQKSKNKRATSWQKQQNGMCAQRRLRSAWASTQSDQSSLCAQWVTKGPKFLHADSEDSDQTRRMPRLIWVFAGRTGHFVGFVMRRLKLWHSILLNVHLWWKWYKKSQTYFTAFENRNFPYHQLSEKLIQTIPN